MHMLRATKTLHTRKHVQAAFGAPIGGVLFSMEEASSFWTRIVAWRCFVAAILAAFTVSLCSQHGDKGFIMFTNVHTLEVNQMVQQAPLMAAVAALGGLLGAVFNSIRRALWSLRAPKSNKGLRIAEALVVIALCVAVKFTLAHWVGTCVQSPDIWFEKSFEVRFCSCACAAMLLPCQAPLHGNVWKSSVCLGDLHMNTMQQKHLQRF